MKKIIISMFTLLLVLAGICFMNVDGSIAMAADGNEKFVAESMTPVEGQVPAKENYIFAGWYKDETCTEPYYSVPTETAYAKFVSEKVLSIKMQLTKGTEAGSPTTNLRLVTSVDSLDYKKVGFKVYFNGATTPVDTGTSRVFERIVASAESGVDYNYSPKVVSTDSEYFATATLVNISGGNFEKDFYIRPYWITYDGTTVYGESRLVQVWHGYTANVINVPVKGTVSGTEVDVTYGDTTVKADVLKVAAGDDIYSQLLIKLGDNGDKTALQSVTTFTGDGFETKYRNLETTHVVSGDATAVNADASWYADYETEDAFVIATSADLYGLTGATSEQTFKGKIIYVVADIEANVGYADGTNKAWDTTKSANGEALEENVTGTAYPWTGIRFNGVFDAQMHTISGIYMTASDSDRGFFSIIDASAVIRNLKLTNGYFNGNGQQRIGSIAGSANAGTLESVYSDAVVVGSNYNIGGLIGRHNKDNTSNLVIKNCWYAGTVSNTKTHTGGLVGNSLSGVTFINCLNTGIVSGAGEYVGGFTGNVSNKTVTLTNCLNSGEVTGDANYVGAIAGNITSGSITSCNTFMTTESSTGAENGGTRDDVISISATNIAGIKALTADTKELFSYIINEETYANESYWAIVSGGTPVLASFKEFAKVDGESAAAMAVDTSWYNNKDTEFVLSDAADLYGLALLSQETDQFTDETIKLNKDIVIPNTGNSEEWSQTVPEFEWIGVGTADFPFAGMFDGQMHTISGIYMNTSNRNTGLFNAITSTTTLCNFSLNNTYIYCSANNMGSVVGYAEGGTLRTIYSDANITSTEKNTGGMVGQINTSPLTMYDCWFDGTVTQSSSNSYTGGLVGILYGGGADITNCLNSGDVSSMTSTAPYVGGLVGGTNINALNITNSLNTGNVYKSNEATQNYGLVIGRWGNYATYAKQISNTYTVSQEGLSYIYTRSGATEVETATFAETSILGTDALKKMPLLFTNIVSASEYASCWAVVVDGVPVLESFADVTEKEYLAIDTSWYNGSGNYTLKDVADLYGFTMLSARINFAGETISLSKNIDSIVINEGEPSTENWNPKYEWNSIGSTSKPFAGTFDGNMKSIEGAYWNCESFSGLFSAVAAGSVIRNLSLKNGYMESSGVNNGSIVGRAFGGMIDTVYSDTIIVGNNTNIGGLVGQVPSSATEALTLNNCWFAGSVTNNTSEAQNTGGLIGTVLKDANVTNCLNTGAISMPNYSKNEGTEEEAIVKPCVGGFVGYVASEVTDGEATRETNVLFSHCFNSGVITYNNVTGITGFGTFVGYTPKTSVCFQNSYSTVENGLKAYARGSNASILSNYKRFENKSDIYGTKALDEASALFEINADENYRVYWAFVCEGTPVLASFAEYVDKDFIAIDTSWYDANEDNYTLNDVGDLYGFAWISDEAAINGYEGKTITLGADITINEETPFGTDGVVGGGDDWADVAPQFEWRSICGNTSYRFNGTFEGNGKTISGLYLDETNKYRGLFGLIDADATLRNFSLVNSYFNSSAQSLGSVVGHSRGTIDTVYSDAIVIGSESNVGGILGQVDSTYGMKSMSNCWFDGTVTNNATEGQRTGGLIGAAIGNVSVENCLNTGAISVPNYAKNEGTEEAPSIKPLVGGLLGYVDSAKTVTVQHCLNIGKVSFNSIATTGFGSVIGRIKSRAEGVAEDGNIIVENTYATSQSSWETVSTSDTWSQVNVSVVDDNVIGGENGKELLSGLFDANLTEKWMIAAEHPVLKVFEKYASTEKNITALHQWVTSSDTLTATLQNLITLPNPEGVALADVRRQGGYTDGRYFYQAFITYTDPGDTDQGIAAETGNKVSVLKYDLINKTEVWLHELTLNHANDITYNSKMKCLVVSHAAPNNKQISYIDVTDEGLVFRETVDIGYDIAYIDYDATRDVYVAGRSSKFFVLNSELKKISKDFTPVRVSGEHTGQGVSCDDNYIYFVLSAGTVETEVIEIYDWSGKLVKTITLDIKTNSETIESENISVVGDKIYIMVAELSDVVGIQYDKPANVYIIDKSITE